MAGLLTKACTLQLYPWPLASSQGWAWLLGWLSGSDLQSDPPTLVLSPLCSGLQRRTGHTV